MSLRNDQTGFSAFEFILLVVVLAVVAVGALRVLNSKHSSTSTVSSTSLTTTGATKAPAINNTQDLTKAQNMLDQNDPTTTNASDSKQLDADLSSVN